MWPLLALAGLFVVPWFAPPGLLGLGATGEATREGFSVGLACLLFSLAVIGASRVRTGPTEGPLLRAEFRWFPSLAEAPIEVTALALVLVVVGLATVLFPATLRMPYFGDQGYFLSRIDLVALGRRPWLDFEFHHGPLLLYLPWLVAKTGVVGFERAYLVVCLLATLVGLAGLFVLTRTLPLPPKSRAVAFALLASPWCVPFVALSRAPLVVLWAPMSVLCAARLERAEVRGALRSLATGTMVVLGFGLGSAAGFGTLAGLAATRGKEDRNLFAAILPLGTVVVLSVVAHAAFGRAGLPLYPNAANLVLAGVTVVVVPRLLEAGRRSRATGALDAGLGAAALVGALAAFSSGEVFDVLAASVVPFVGLLALAASRLASVRLTLGLAGFVGLVAQLAFWVARGASYGDALVSSAFFHDDPSMLEAHRRAWETLRRSSPRASRLAWDDVVPFPVEGHLVPAGVDWCLPLGGMTDGGADRRAKLRERSPVPYYPIPTEGLEAADVERAAASALGCAFVVLPARLLDSLDQDPPGAAERHRRWLADRLLFPVPARDRESPDSPRQQLARAILRRSTVVGAPVLPGERAPTFVVLAPRRPAP